MHPIVLIEGLDGVGKTTLTRQLAHQLGAELIASPPALSAHAALGPLRAHFDQQPANVRRAYYQFANLIVSEHSIAVRAARPVVIDRYWPSTVAFGVGIDGSSALGEWLGRYPPELVIPDVMVLLEVDEPTRARRLGGRGDPRTGEEDALASDARRRAAVSAAYRHFNPVILDTSSLDEVGVLAAVLRALDRKV